MSLGHHKCRWGKCIEIKHEKIYNAGVVTGRENNIWWRNQSMMKIAKRILCAIIATIILVIGFTQPMTASAEETTRERVSETKKQSKKDKISVDEIPDALESNKELKKELSETYSKRIYSEEKDLNTLLFEKENGERVMYVFKKPVKYKDENGNTVDKSVSFKKIDAYYQAELKDRYVCDNGDNDVKVYMPFNMSDGIKITNEGKSLRMYLGASNKKNLKVSLEDNKVTYEAAFGENTSLQYKPLVDGIKEEIVLKKYTGQTEFTFYITTDGYKIVTQDDNCLYLQNPKNGEIEGIIDSVYMIDNAGKTDFNNFYTYKELKNGVYSITAHVNKEFLTSDDTQYPVIIDPPITISKDRNANGIYDSTMNSTDTSAGTSGSLFVGYRGGVNGISRVVMSFPGLNFDASKVSVVISASISMRDLLCESTAMGMQCLALTNVPSGWTEANANWNYMNMSGSCYTTTGSSTKTISYSNGVNQSHTYTYDITTIVQNWRAGTNNTSAKKGIVFKSTNESVLVHKTFGSYNRASYNPVFTMSYVPYGGGYDYNSFLSLRSQKYRGTSSKEYLPNCIGLALHLGLWIDANIIGISESCRRNVELVAKQICNYANTSPDCSKIKSAEYLGYGLKSSYNLTDKQYLIAVRVFENTNINPDTHAVVQLNNGKWIDKHGALYEIEQLGYINPDKDIQTCWRDPNLGYYYDSDTVYIRITIN